MSDTPRKPRRWLAAAIAASAEAAKAPPPPFARADRPRRASVVAQKRTAVAAR